MNPEEVGSKIETSLHALVDARNALAAKYSWNDTDARLTILNKCSSILIAINLGYVFIHKCLSKEQWWRENSTLPINHPQMVSGGNEFEMMLRISLIHNILYSVESSFRIYVRAIDSSACSGGHSEFKGIYEWLLKRTGLQCHSSLLDLWRNIRNTMHNNGLFMPQSGRDTNVMFKGVSYDFVVGKPAEFVTTEFIVDLLPDMTQTIIDVLESSQVSSLSHLQEIT